MAGAGAAEAKLPVPPMTTRLRLFPLSAVLFPGTVMKLHVFEPRYKQMIAECIESGESFGIALIAEGAEAGDPAVMPHEIGSIAEIIEVAPLPFGRYLVSTIGRGRFRIREVTGRDPYLTAEVDLIEEDFVEDERSEGLADRVRALYLEYCELIVEFSGKPISIDLSIDSQRLSFLIGEALQVGAGIKQQLLATLDTSERLDLERSFLERALPQLRALLERSRRELEARRERGEDPSYRPAQEKFFGQFFSLN